MLVPLNAFTVIYSCKTEEPSAIHNIQILKVIRFETWSLSVCFGFRSFCVFKEQCRCFREMQETVRQTMREVTANSLILR